VSRRLRIGERRRASRRVRRSRLAAAACVVAATVAPQAIGLPAASAGTTAASVANTVALSTLSPPSPDPSGIAYDPANDRLLIADSEVDEMSIFQQVNLYATTRSGTLAGTGSTTAYSNEPAGIGFDPGSGHLFVSDDVQREVFEVAPGGDGALGTGDDVVVTSFSTAAYGNGDPEDVAFDTDTGDLYVSDGIGAEVYRVRSGDNGVFDGVPPAGDDVASHFDIGRFGAEDAEGIDYDAARHTLLVADRNTDTIYELHPAGLLANAIDVSGAGINHPADVAVAPASDGSAGSNLYVVARGEDNDRDPLENDGMLFELAVSLPPIGNLTPVVDAGANVAVTLPANATLSGDAVDDGLPSGSLSTTWSQVSGPAGATIGDPSSLSTTVSFASSGTYVFRLTGDDSALSSTDDVTVFVAAAGSTIVERPVAAGYDDAEEAVGGNVNLGSSDLELVNDGSRGNQTVGVRFTGVQVPHGATITKAYVQFQADRATTAAAALPVQGQAADNATRFTRTSGSISARPRTAASVAWTPAPWPTGGAAGADQRTADLSPVIQELVNRTGWASGNAMVLIVTGTGKRAAESFNGNVPPVLHVEYAGSGLNKAPVVNAGPDQQLTLPDNATVSGSVSDDGAPNPPASVSTTWTLVSGPEGVVFGDASSQTTSVSFLESGTYVLRLTADDAAAQGSDELTITVNAATSNLVANPGFETDTSGWNVSGSDPGVTLSRVGGGHAGSWSAQLDNGGAAGAMCKLNDQPNSIASTSAGTYTASLWARAGASGATLNLRLREYVGGTLVGTPTRSTLVLSTSWQRVSVAYTVTSPGSSLDLQAWIASAPTGTCFLADDVAITRS
jgi:K319-like protein/carbohydrate binding protein with CBM4/9 domain